MMWTVAFSLLKRFYGPVAVVLLACTVWLLIRCGLTAADLKIDLGKTQSALLEVNGKLATVEKAHADLLRDYNSAARESEARERTMLAERETAVQHIKATHEQRTQALDRSLQLALNGLRHSADSDSRRALEAAAAAPAACRGYEASPTQLSVRSAEFLVGYGARADSAVLQLAACQQYIREVIMRP